MEKYIVEESRTVIQTRSYAVEAENELSAMDKVDSGAVKPAAGVMVDEPCPRPSMKARKVHSEREWKALFVE